MNRKTPFSVKEANESPGFLLWQLTMLWQRRIAAVLRPHDLTQVQYALLDAMMTSQVLRTLEGKGLVDRNAHPSDARAKILALTRRGRALAWEAVPLVEQADGAFFGAIGSRLGKLNESLRFLIESGRRQRRRLQARQVEVQEGLNKRRTWVSRTFLIKRPHS